MSFTYAAGDSTPGLAGMASIGSIRINQNGTFEMWSCGRLTLTPPRRNAVTTLPNAHGATVGTPLYTEFPFTIEGQLTVPTLSDIWAAYDLLFQTFHTDAGLQVLTLNTSGWSAARQCTVELDGQITLLEPSMFAKQVPDRQFTIPLVAPDPRLYATSVTSTNVTTATTVTNNGTASSPITVRFNGARTNPQIDGPGTAGTNRIRVAATIASGDWIEVTVDPVNGVTALDNAGANRYADVTALTASVVPSGASSWTATSDSGAGTVTVKFRDAWL